MKRISLSKLLVVFLALMLMTSGLTGCKMNLPDTSKIGPDGAASSADSGEDGEEDSENSDSDEGGLTLEDILASGDESGDDSNLESDVTS